MLRRTDGGFDLALSAYWLTVRCFRAVTSLDDIFARLAELPPPKSDQRAAGEQRQRLLLPLLEQALTGGAR